MRHFPKFTPAFIFLLGISTIAIMAMACQDRKGNTIPTSLSSHIPGAANYAQMPGGSTTVLVNGEQHQINFVLSDWEVYPYGTWIYAEINEQIGCGKIPGVDQIPVSLRDVTLTFSGLPGEVSEIIIGIKEKETPEERYREIGRYPVQNNFLIIPVSYQDLVAYFGITHYSVWFQVIGSQHGQGMACAWLEMSGTLPDGQRVNLRKNICFRTGVTPAPTPPPSPVMLTYPGATHTDVECVAAGGSVYLTSSGTICRFSTQGYCPIGWSQAGRWQRAITNAEWVASFGYEFCGNTLPSAYHPYLFADALLINGGGGTVVPGDCATSTCPAGQVKIYANAGNTQCYYTPLMYGLVGTGRCGDYPAPGRSECREIGCM